MNKKDRVHLELNRMRFEEQQTLGRLDVYKNGVWQCCLATLEQEWANNKKNDSCIFPDYYIIEHYDSEKHPNSFIIQGTKDRTYILIHILNTYKQTAGCIGVGLFHDDINGDKLLDTVSSTIAFDKLRKITKGVDIISLKIN